MIICVVKDHIFLCCVCVEWYLHAIDCNVQLQFIKGTKEVTHFTAF